jgi:uncharacterized damage-inducible protein DinB
VDNVEQIERLLRHDDWANRETLIALERISEPPPRSVRILGHIVGSELLWHARLRGGEKPPAVWPDFSLEDCRKRLDEIGGLWRIYTGELTEAKLRESVSYVNSKGEPWTSSVEDILTHVALHSSHHRGQIAADLRAAGHTPPYTDYIHAARRGLVG